MRLGATSVMLVGLLPSMLGAQGVACGTERWNVKLLRDRDSATVDFRAAPTSVAALVALPVPREPASDDGRAALERRTFRVRAILAQRITSNDDRDYHLVLRDVGDPTKTMIAEIPDSTCAVGSRRASDFAEARRMVDSMPDGLEFEVEGVAFFDRIHGQLGVAPNGIELHPVLSITPILTKGDILMEEVGAAPTTNKDIRVWLNTASRVYHCPGSAMFGNTSNGTYMPESAAKRAGARPAGGRPCG